MKASYRELVLTSALGLGYLLAVYLGLPFVVKPKGVAAIWPASGVALAALLLRPRRAWPATLGMILAINGLANWAAGSAPALCLGFALANSAEPLLAALLLGRVLGKPLTLAQLREVVWLVGLAVVLGNALTALLGAAVAALFLAAPFWATWRVWWIADGLGMLLVTPLLVTWAGRPWRFLTPARAGEGLLLFLLLAVGAWGVFMTAPAEVGLLSYPYILFPLLLWAAMRFGPSGATLALVLMGAISLWGSLQGRGLFEALSPNHLDHLLLTQLFLGVMGCSTLVLAASIAESRQGQEVLRQSEEKWRSLFEILPVGVSVINAQNEMADLNPSLARLLDISAAGIVKGDYRGRRYFRPDDTPMPPEEFPSQRAMREQALVQDVEIKVETESGAIIWTNVSAAPLSSGAGVVIVTTDITQHKRLEQNLIRTQRLRAVGELSAGVSHNLNNLLTGVLVPAEMLQLASDDPKVKRLSGMIVESGARAAELVHRLRQSVSVAAEALGPVALNQAIDAVVQMMRARWKDEPEARGLNIEVYTELGEVPWIRGLRSQLYDLLTDLLLNAVEAMPQGGAITIKTALEEELVRLDFGDTGIGIDEATRLRVFEPFFTTKQSVGTGLGLAMLHNSVTQWGGTVGVESTPGKGATFILRFPVWQEVASAAPEPEPVAEFRAGRVLIVEDDLAVGTVLVEALGARHRVEVFADGLQALEHFGTGKYDVAIIDLGLAKTAGDQVAEQIRVIDPAVGRILFTGWELEANDPRRRVFDFALQKPLRDLATLEAVVTQAIILRDQRLQV